MPQLVTTGKSNELSAATDSASAAIYSASASAAASAAVAVAVAACRRRCFGQFAICRLQRLAETYLARN